jgi:hypothetical protein
MGGLALVGVEGRISESLRGNQEGVKGIILVGVKRMQLGKIIALAGNLCL